VRAFGGHRLGEVLQLMEEFEEAVCVSFHVITFVRAADGKLGQRLNERRIAPSASSIPRKFAPEKQRGAAYIQLSAAGASVP
jgi:hypothetical protein